MPRKREEVRLRYCGACGAAMYRTTGEKKHAYEERQTCKTKECRDGFAAHGRRFPLFLDKPAVATGTVLAPELAAMVLARRLPAFLTSRSVEKAVENRVTA